MRKDIQRQTELTGEQWHGIGRQSFLRLYSEALSARNRVQAALDYDIDTLPDATVITERQGGIGHGYLTWLKVYSRQQGQSEVDSEFFVVHSEQPITPAEAMRKAKQGFEQSQQDVHGTYAGFTFIGATYSGTWKMSPRQAA